jgi:hypothetical protein
MERRNFTFNESLSRRLHIFTLTEVPPFFSFVSPLAALAEAPPPPPLFFGGIFVIFKFFFFFI